MYKEDPEQRLEPSGEVKTRDVEQHPSACRWDLNLSCSEGHLGRRELEERMGLEKYTNI